jgi:hypothetical protein
MAPSIIATRGHIKTAPSYAVHTVLAMYSIDTKPNPSGGQEPTIKLMPLTSLRFERIGVPQGIASVRMELWKGLDRGRVGRLRWGAFLIKWVAGEATLGFLVT